MVNALILAGNVKTRRERGRPDPKRAAQRYRAVLSFGVGKT
jgi:hypothetical protein